MHHNIIYRYIFLFYRGSIINCFAGARKFGGFGAIQSQQSQAIHRMI